MLSKNIYKTPKIVYNRLYFRTSRAHFAISINLYQIFTLSLFIFIAIMDKLPGGLKIRYYDAFRARKQVTWGHICLDLNQ